MSDRSLAQEIADAIQRFDGEYKDENEEDEESVEVKDAEGVEVEDAEDGEVEDPEEDEIETMEVEAVEVEDG